jgi:protein ERP2
MSIKRSYYPKISTIYINDLIFPTQLQTIFQTVFFEFFIMDDDYEYDDYDSEEYLDFQKNLKKDDYEEDTLKSLTDRLHKIKQNHGKTMQYQAFIRAHEARDRNVIEHNYERVNFWSAIHMIAMICTAVFQV